MKRIHTEAPKHLGCLRVVNLRHLKTRVQLKIFLSEYPCKHQVKRIHTEIRMFQAPKYLSCLQVAKYGISKLRSI